MSAAPTPEPAEIARTSLVEIFSGTKPVDLNHQTRLMLMKSAFSQVKPEGSRDPLTGGFESDRVRSIEIAFDDAQRLPRKQDDLHSQDKNQYFFTPSDHANIGRKGETWQMWLDTVKHSPRDEFLPDGAVTIMIRPELDSGKELSETVWQKNWTEKEQRRTNYVSALAEYVIENSFDIGIWM